MPRRAVLYSALLCLVLLAPVSPAVDLEKEREGVLAAEAAFVAAGNARDREAFAAFLDPEATYLGERAARGRDAFAAYWGPLFDPKKEVSISWQPVVAQVAGSGELAFTIGQNEMRWRKLGTDQFNEMKGHSLTVWKKDAEGAWKLWAGGTLVVHPDPELGISHEPRYGLAWAWKWELLNAPDATAELAFRPETTLAAESGEMAVTFGAYDVAARRGEASEVGRGHFVEVRTKNADGRWVLTAGGYTPPLDR